MNEASEYKSNVVDFPTGPFGDRGGGGGLQPPGDGGGIEARIARVESDVSHIQNDLSEIKQDVKALEVGQSDHAKALVRVEEQIKHLPSKSYSIVQLGILLGLFAAIVVYVDNIRAFVGAQ